MTEPTPKIATKPAPKVETPTKAIEKAAEEVMAVEQIAKRGTISVQPYFDPTIKNMGLEKYNIVLFDGVSQAEQLTCLERNGVRQYVTGLNEFDASVQNIKDPEKKAAVIQSIREKIIFLEQSLASNVIKIDDPDFWSKVTTVGPKNYEFWDKVYIAMSNEPLFLDPADPMGLVKLCAIEAGGFQMIAKSLEDARSRSVPIKFYLDKTEDAVSTRTEITKLRNKALGILGELFETNQNKLFYVVKALDGNSAQYRKSTPNDIMYENLDAYICAKGIESSPKRAAKSFIETCDMSMEDLILKAIIKDATFYKYIATGGDGMIRHGKSGSMLGRNPSDCVEHLRNPLNDQTFSELKKEVERHWNT